MAIYTAAASSYDGAYVDRENPNQNYSGSTLKIGNVTSSGYKRYFAFLKFDVSDLAEYTKKRINTVTWRFYLTTKVEGDIVGFNAYALDDGYAKNNITFNNAPNASDEEAFNAYLDLFYDESESGSVEIEGWIDGYAFYENANIGFKLDIYRRNPYNPENQNVFTSTSPRLTFEFEDFSPIITSALPIGGAFVDYSKANIFQVSFVPARSLEPIKIVSYEVQYKADGVTTTKTYSANITVVRSEAGESFLAPINVRALDFDHGKNYQWRARFTTDDGVTTAYSDWASFTTIDVTPNAPKIISPQSSYLDASSQITLAWEHDIDSGSTQYAYDIDYKQSGNWIALRSHVISSAQNSYIPANTLEAGSFVWRVRTYNADNVPGLYSESATNIIQAKPAQPIFSSITTIPRITVTWQSSGQQAYELYIGNIRIYDFGVMKSYQFGGYLPDGTYAIKLRIQNSQGLWSEYAQASIQIRNVQLPGESILSATQVPGGVWLRATLPPVASGSKYLNEAYIGEFYVAHQPKPAQGTGYILRDGVPIGRLTENAYVDYASAGLHGYAVRIVKDGYYYDSPVVYVAPRIRYGVMAAADNLSDFIPLSYRLDSKPQPQKQLTKGYNSHYFSGRNKEVYDVTEHYAVSWQIENTMARENYNKLDAWAKAGAAVLLRYRDGTRIYGIIQSLTVMRALRDIMTVSFTVMESEWEEGIPYV